jgi:hypothetical protein
MASVGQELLDVPFPDMVLKLALGIAEAQKALDENSVETALALADTSIPVVLGVTQTIDEQGEVTYSQPEPIPVTLLQLGLNPTFYQFSESTIEVSMDIKTTMSRETNLKLGVQAKVGFRVFSSSIKFDLAHNRKFGKEVHGTSRLFTRLVPVPPPPRIVPEVTVIDLRPTEPAPQA